MTAIPRLVVTGSHRDIGRQLGEALAPAIRRAVDFGPEALAGRSFGELMLQADPYRAATRAATPWLIEELDGVAETAGVDALALFAASTEELFSAPIAIGAGPAIGRCSDLVAGPPLTVDGHLRVAHNNDLPPQAEQDVVAVEWRVPGEPVIFSLGIGPWISVGWNDSGLSLTGNELTPNDTCVGVPRLLMVREQLTAPTLDAALAMTLRPDRASSYNTVLAHRDGRAVNVEGSATDVEVSTPGQHGWMAHTNHYVCERMLRYEGDPEYAQGSAVRHHRASELLGSAAPGSIDAEWLRAALSDHATDPAICRHGGPDGRSRTVFWCLADVTAGQVRYGLGTPCRPGEERFSFDSA